MASAEEVGQAMKIIKASCAKADDMRPETEALYAMRLREQDGRLLEPAVMRVIDTFVPTAARPFPSIADIHAALHQLNPDGRPSPELAWTEVLTQVREVGCTWGIPSPGPKFTTPLIREALAAVGSWGAICKAESQESNRARFVDAYRVLLERERFEESLPPRVRKLVADVKAERAAKRIAGGGP